MSQTVYTPNAPAAIGPYSQAVVCNGLVFTSGQIAINPLSQKVEATTIEEQTKQVLTNLTAVLEAAGSSMEKVVKTTVFSSKYGRFRCLQCDLCAVFPGASRSFLCRGQDAAQSGTGRGRSYRRTTIMHFLSKRGCCKIPTLVSPLIQNERV